MLKSSRFLLPPVSGGSLVDGVVRSWWEEETVPRGAFFHTPLSPINGELTRAEREVAESSLVPPLPQRGSPQLWEGLLPLLLLLPPLPPPLDKLHQYLQ